MHIKSVSTAFRTHYCTLSLVYANGQQGMRKDDDDAVVEESHFAPERSTKSDQ